MNLHQNVLFLNGEFQPRTDTFEVINPSTAAVLGHSVEGRAADIDEAVRLAQEAFDDGRWTSIDPLERTRILSRAAQLIRERESEFSAVMSAEMGMSGVTSVKTVGWMKKPSPSTSPPPVSRVAPQLLPAAM